MNKLDIMIQKLEKNKREEKKQIKIDKEKDYIHDLKRLKKEVEQSLNRESIYITAEGRFEKIFAMKFFKTSSEILASGTCLPIYKIKMNKRGLKKLYKEINKYKLEE